MMVNYVYGTRALNIKTYHAEDIIIVDNISQEIWMTLLFLKQCTLVPLQLEVFIAHTKMNSLQLIKGKNNIVFNDIVDHLLQKLSGISVRITWLLCILLCIGVR